MKTTLLRFTAIAALALAGTAHAAPPSYELTLPDQPAWAIGHQQVSGDAFLKEYVKDGETVKGWSELVTVMHMTPKVKVSAEAVAERSIAGLGKGCPSLKHTVLSSDPARVVFRWSDEGCGGWPAQEVVSHIVATDTGVMNFQYAYIKGKATPDFESWVTRIAGAKVTQ